MAYRRIRNILHMQRLLDKSMLRMETLFCQLGQEIYAARGEVGLKAQEMMRLLESEGVSEKALRERLAFAKDRRICPSCDAEQNREHHFCSRCGHSFQDDEAGGRRGAECPDQGRRAGEEHPAREARPKDAGCCPAEHKGTFRCAGDEKAEERDGNGAPLSGGPKRDEGLGKGDPAETIEAIVRNISHPQPTKETAGHEDGSDRRSAPAGGNGARPSGNGASASGSPASRGAARPKPQPPSPAPGGEPYEDEASEGKGLSDGPPWNVSRADGSPPESDTIPHAVSAEMPPGELPPDHA